MKLNIKKGLVVSTVAFSLLLTGCGGSGSGASDDNTITVWAMGDEGKALPELAAKYEEANPGMTVEVQAIPWDNAHDKLVTAVASKSGPDLIQMGTSWMPEFADAGALLDLTDYVADHPNISQDNFFEGSLESVEYDGSYYGVPWYIETRVLYYRTDLLAEVGYNEAPKTWDELKDASTKLANREGGKYGLDLNPKDQFFTTVFAWQNGSEIIADGVPQFDTPEFKGAVEYLQSYFVEGLSPEQDDMDIVQAFKEGIKPMFISGPWMLNAVADQAPEIEGDWAVAVLPAGPAGNTSYMGGSNMSVFQHSDNIDGAIDFVDFLMEEETQMDWLEMTNTLPSLKSAWDQQAVLKEDPYLSVFGEQLNNAKSSPFLKEWEAIAQETNKMMNNVVIGKQNVDEQLKQLNDLAASMID